MMSPIRSAIQSAKAVVFDFDGTLVDSTDIKKRGFDYTFADYPEFMPEIQAYCHGNNHTIRFEKFRYVTEQILHLPYTPEMERRFSQRFADFTTEAVAASPEIPGAEVFLRSLAAYRPALLSSTPTGILLTILDRRGWRDLFSTIQGAPINKQAWLQGFQNLLGCRADEIVFFGDTDEDERSGKAAGCIFVRVGPAVSGNGDRLAVRDFTDL